MPELDLVLRGRRVVTAHGMHPAGVGVRAGRIVALEPPEVPLPAVRTVELADDEVLMPGLVDSHVHVNEPGRTEWEGFSSATRAAAAGGVTTIVDMPLNSLPPTIDLTALRAKRRAARGQCFVDVGFWGGAVPGNQPRWRELHDAGVFGFKCFLSPSGVEEFPPLNSEGLGIALAELRGYHAMLIVHAEHGRVLDAAPAPAGACYDDFLRSRPRRAENLAITEVIERARRLDARVHILHLSSADALPTVAAARRDGVRVTAETCPHYLSLAAEDIPDGATQFKCCPPIREAANRELLWQALRDGVIDCVVSDHSPSTVELKRLDVGDFGLAWGGISSLQVSLAVTWTEARRRGHTLVDVSRWMAAGPARLARLATKGELAVGRDADLVVFAPDQEFVVDPARLHHRNAVTAYTGRALAGVVRATWLAGELVDFQHPRGRLLSREGS